jgi:hypothetical protein
MQSKAQEIVKTINDSLIDHFKSEITGGGRVFLDETEIKTGQFVDPVIRKGLCNSAVTIVMLTETYFDSEYCCTEWAITEALQGLKIPKSEESCFIHILLQDKLDLPKEIGQIQYKTEFREILVYNSPCSTHEKWLILIKRLADDIRRICTVICENNSKISKKHQRIATETGPKTFTRESKPKKGLFSKMTK